MRPSLAIVFAATLLPATLLGRPQPRPTSLFDGRTFTGWDRTVDWVDITLTELKP